MRRVDQRAKHEPVHGVLADGARLFDQPSADVRVGDLVRLGVAHHHAHRDAHVREDRLDHGQ